MQWLHLAAALAPGLALVISEIMPFTSGKANGILHAVYLALKQLGDKGGAQ